MLVTSKKQPLENPMFNLYSQYSKIKKNTPLKFNIAPQKKQAC